MLYRAFRYRIYPKPNQETPFTIQFGHGRFVYNWGLALRKAYFVEHGKGIGLNELKQRMTALKHTEGFSFLKEAHSQVLQAKLEDLDTAYKNFFERRAGYPRFKSRKNEQKIRYPQGFKIDNATGRVYLPKIGWVKTVFHRPLEGNPKSITVSKTKSGKYFISILCEIEKSNQPHGQGVVGVDLGLKHFAILSTGEKIDTPEYLRKAEWKLKRLQKRLSRKKKDSANREKARIRIAHQHERVANQRKDFLDRVSFMLARSYHTIKLENLNILGMVKNHSLAKSIYDSGWGMFGEMLAYKAANLEKIDRFYPSSKMCSMCGTINHKLQLQHRFWKCPKCGTEHDRDINAAQNILAAPTVGSTGRYTPVETVEDGVGLCSTRSGQ